MSSDNKQSFLYQKLRQSSTEELEEALRSESWYTGNDAMDEAMLLAITDILIERDPTSPEQRAVETEKALQDFWKYYAVGADNMEFDTEDIDRLDRVTSIHESNSKPVPAAQAKTKHKHWGYWLAGAAVFLIVVGFPVAKATNFNLFRTVYHWVDGKIIYSAEDAYENPASAAAFQVLLDSCDIPISFRELWTPKNYVGFDISTTEYPESTHYSYELRNAEQQSLMFEIIEYKNNIYKTAVESNDDDIEEYPHEDCIYRISKNTDNIFAVTHNDNCELTISGDITSEEMHQIIDSIE